MGMALREVLDSWNVDIVVDLGVLLEDLQVTSDSCESPGS